MNKKLVYVYDNSMYMFVDKSIDEVNEKTKCVVYNADLEEMSPEMCVGSWTCRMGPWIPPTQDQNAKGLSILSKE